jgi:NAD+ kinase
VTPPRAISLYTHKFPDQTGEAVKRLIEAAARDGITVHVEEDEAAKHGLEGLEGVRVAEEPDDRYDLAVVLGGDGTILEALRAVAGTGTPVFAFNYGAIGFLATVDPEEFEDGLRRVLTGDFEVVHMPALAVDPGGGEKLGVNDISFHRRPDGRVAELGYSVTGDRLGEVRCDGLVVSTPVGSTGYNLANGGPILAWGVEGYVVSFIAPHTLTARALVVAPSDVLRVQNLSSRESVDVTTDGRAVGVMGPGEELEVRFIDDQAHLAQIPGATFYHRFREKFGRLAY